MNDQVQAVVIGGGIVDCSLLDARSSCPVRLDRDPPARKARTDVRVNLTRCR